MHIVIDRQDSLSLYFFEWQKSIVETVAFTTYNLQEKERERERREREREGERGRERERMDYSTINVACGWTRRKVWWKCSE